MLKNKLKYMTMINDKILIVSLKKKIVNDVKYLIATQI